MAIKCFYTSSFNMLYRRTALFLLALGMFEGEGKISNLPETRKAVDSCILCNDSCNLFFFPIFLRNSVRKWTQSSVLLFFSFRFFCIIHLSFLLMFPDSRIVSQQPERDGAKSEPSVEKLKNEFFISCCAFTMDSTSEEREREEKGTKNAHSSPL